MKLRLLIYDERLTDNMMQRVLERRAAQGVDARVIGEVEQKLRGMRVASFPTRLHVRAIAAAPPATRARDVEWRPVLASERRMLAVGCRTFLLALSALLSGPGLLLHAQAAAPDPEATGSGRPARLFRDDAPLVLTLAADFRAVFGSRDTLTPRRDPASLTFPGDSGPVTVPVELSTRGHFRLKSSTCQFPPLKVWLDRERVKKTPFAGQGSLKLITHCDKAPRYEQNLLIEHGIYRAYNQVTDLSHRSRLARITYADSKDPSRTLTRYGFFLEDDDEMARRNGGAILPMVGGMLDEMDPAQMDLVAVFEYLVGNTDWSVVMIHNIRLVQIEGRPSFFPVAYDFDWSGLVNAPYARPDPRLGTKTVRERVYRGACRPM
ncbi:MAG TPA: hypothetical protein VFU46_04495, partial [Gemmatimonadales bacterium]|nr:hypothetical protein [Gemmatimonadales bacterium]